MHTWYLLGIILWVIFAFWPAIVAKRKGYSFLLFFIFSIFLFIIALITAYIVKDKTQTAADKAADRAAENILDKEENTR